MSWGAYVHIFLILNESYKCISIQFKQSDRSTDNQIILKRALMHTDKHSPVHLSFLQFNVIFFPKFRGGEIIVLSFTLNQRFQT